MTNPDILHAPVAAQPSNPGATALWSGFLLCIVILSLGASWLTLKQVDFGYPFLHSFLNIDQQIQKHAPNNRYRDHFEKTTPAEHKRLFHEIVIGIDSAPDRLKDITYYAPDGAPLGKLSEPEVIHLQDVKVLVDRFLLMCLSTVPLGAGLFWVIRQRHIPFPGVKRIMKLSAGAIALITAVVMLIGPTAVFYQLHIWLFPPENQWFFYYYESLMTTLMVAPVIFGPIAIFIVLGALPYAVSLSLVTQRLCAHPTDAAAESGSAAKSRH